MAAGRPGGLTLTAAVGTNSQALWYLTRGFGLVALILLTLTMVLGLTQSVRFARPGMPRFVRSALTVFAHEIDRHRQRGGCRAPAAPLPFPALQDSWR